ncbi:hypothetical protein [Citrobacter freundii]|uniref:hypothetical protein n=2 Tax=Citrobacter freundii TaxID=546 RepID=UPI00193B5558|nr:hypothetical protein [Citrobacter freundii]MBM3010017.1 hypothetical protein [Citrobacter freundii]
MKKSVFDEGFSESFVKYVKELQALDARSTKQPLYREKLNYVFGTMSERFLARLRQHVGEVNTSALTLDHALSYYVHGGEGDRVLDYIASRIRPLCESMHISPEAYRVEMDNGKMIFHTWPVVFRDEIAAGANPAQFAAVLVAAGMMDKPEKGLSKKTLMHNGKQERFIVLRLPQDDAE